MGVNWNRIINAQAKGVDPVTAFNQEQKRMREENHKRFEQAKRRPADNPDDPELGEER